MIVQAISLLDDLDKELNTYAMRVKEWYGWHFPELTRIITENMVYARVVHFMGSRTNIPNVDLTDVLAEDQAKLVSDGAALSMGTDINDEDMSYIKDLCEQVIEIAEYREELSGYIKNRMHAIAPNLTLLVGELVGARLIAHAGSLINLAKHPASTVQILGAEKALFRALKTKKPTPKYGLIYHASIVGHTAPKNKGKVSRILANKAVLGCRVDALGDENTKKISIDNLKKIHLRLLQLEGRAPTTTPTGIPLEKYESPQETTPMWNPEDDVVLEQPVEEKKHKKRKRESGAGDGDGKKDKKKARRHSKA
jgi:nucleolar protein 58